MAHFGYALLLLALVVATYTACAAIVGHKKGSRRIAVSAQYGALGVFGVLTCAAFTLIYLFLTNDYSVKYVHHYSDRSMPLFYKATALWGGQDGSLLFWVWVMSTWGAIAVFQNRDKNKDMMPYTIATLMVVALFFISMLCFSANPFELYLAGAPTDGKGLNPLLQNPYMAIHPPTLYLGYIGWTIPFCFGMGALIHGKLDYSWIAAMRRWCLVAWVFLSVGLTLGGLWAYEELGWGGYWAWDPVENAAFIPWLTGTAFIHSIQVQERRQIFKVWNMVLIILTFLLTLFGTMMTRSGFAQSVHAFAQSDLGIYFVSFIIFSAVFSFGMLLYRAEELAPKLGLESILSREFAFLVNNWVLLAAAFFVTFGTALPPVFKWATGTEVNVGVPFFNRWMIPIGLILLALTGIGPLLSWRKSTGATIRQQFVGPAVIGVVTLLILTFWVKINNWPALATFTLCAFVTSTILQEFFRGTRHRMRNAGEKALDAFLTLIARARRRYGGYVIHFGVCMMMFGFAGNAFKQEEDKRVAMGEVTNVGRFDIRMDDLTFEDDGQKNMVTAHVTVFDHGTENVIAHLNPAKWLYRKSEEQQTTEVDKRMSFQDDLYLVLGGYDAEAKQVVLQVKINPLVNFVWLGCTFLMMGFSIAVWPERKLAEQRLPVRRFVPAALGASTLLLGMLSAILAFI